MNEHLCLGCMKEKPDDGVCPFCKFDPAAQNKAPYLPLGTELETRYIIGCVLNYNGEGATYLGFDKQENVPVRIREYFPIGLCSRGFGDMVTPDPAAENVYGNQMSAFLELARALARMRSLSGILPVYDIFEANATAYYITESVESISLREFLVRNGGRLTFDQARPLFMPILSSLESLHATGIIHRGISPETLIIGKDGKLRLTNFCIENVHTARTELTPELFKGYAAIEQYGFEGDQGPWTDIYALAATLYRTLVGNPPPEATDRVTNDKLIIPANIAENLPVYVMNGLANALQILPADRTASVELFREEISAAPGMASRRQAPESQDAERAPKKSKGASKKYILISSGLTLAVLAIIVVILIFTVFRKPIFGDGSGGNIFEPSATQNSTIDYSNQLIDPDKGEALKLIGLNFADFLSSTNDSYVRFRNNYNLVVSSKEYSAQPKGTVLRQEPAAGAAIKKGDTIKVVLSLGSDKFAMPSIVGLTYEQGYIKLLEAGFAKENVTVSEKYSPNMEPNTIVEVDPKSGSAITADSKVTIYVNSYKTAPTTRWVEPEPETDAPETDTPETPSKTSKKTTRAPSSTSPNNWEF